MKLENQVSSLELSKKLKELGVPQESLFWWWTDGYEYSCRYGIPTYGMPARADYSAFTAAELGEMLKEKYPMCISGEKIVAGKWKIDFFKEDTEADVRAKALIYLLENKLITL